MSPRPWTLLAERTSYSGFVSVKTATFRHSDGHDADWDLIVGSDVVAVLAMTPGRDVILTRQFRPGPGMVMDELPGGIIDPGEEPAAAAARELREETGYAGSVELVGSLRPSASMTRRNWVAVSTDCSLVAAQDLGEDEDIEVVLKPFDVFRSSLREAPTTDLGAAYLALDHLGLLGHL